MSVAPPPVPKGIAAQLKASSSDRDKLVMILVHVVKCPMITKAAMRAFETSQPFGRYRDLEMIWESLQAFITAYEQPPSRDILCIDLKKRIADGEPDQNYFDLQTLSNEIYNHPMSSLREAYAADLISEYRDDLALRGIQKGMAAGETAGEIKERADRLAAPVMCQPKTISVFGDGFEKNLIASVKDPTYIDWLDKATNGGMSVGESMALIIPSSCGKTLLAFQFARMCVLNGIYLDYHMFEQGGESGDLALRNYVNASGGSIKEWKAYAEALKKGETGAELEARLSAKTREGFAKMRTLWPTYFWQTDWTDHRMVIDGIEDVFRNLKEREDRLGKKARWLIIDWWGNLWIRIALSHPRWSESQIYMRMQASLMQIGSLSAQYGVSTIVLQQYAGAVRSMTKAKTTDAQGNKNFDNYFSYCLAFSMKNPVTNEMNVNAGKMRAAEQSVFKVRMNGDKARIESVGPEEGTRTAGEAQAGGQLGNGIWN